MLGETRVQGGYGPGFLDPEVGKTGVARFEPIHTSVVVHKYEPTGRQDLGSPSLPPVGAAPWPLQDHRRALSSAVIRYQLKMLP